MLADKVHIGLLSGSLFAVHIQPCGQRYWAAARLACMWLPWLIPPSHCAGGVGAYREASRVQATQIDLFDH